MITDHWDGKFHFHLFMTVFGLMQARIYAWAPGARAQGGILKKLRLKYVMWKKKAVHEREV